MPPKFRHPKNNDTVKSAHFVAQGRCDDATKISGYMIKKGTTDKIPGRVLGSKKKKHFGLLFKNLTAGDYTLHVDETNSPVVSASLNVRVAPPPPPPPPPEPPPPNVTAPIDSEELPFVFYPYGDSAATVTSVVFSDTTGAPSVDASASILQDAGSSFWAATVEVPEDGTFQTPGSYKLDVSNGQTTTVGNLTLTNSPPP